MIPWMEDNQEVLIGKQVALHEEVKEGVFSNESDVHIAGRKITDKVHKMKKG